MRLDKFLCESELVKSRTHASVLIKSGKVLCNNHVQTKPSFEVGLDDIIRIVSDDCPYVSRGALKLIHALRVFRVSPDGLVCVDIGASTGGFTQVLLNNNAKRVYAIDSGHDQLDPILRKDSRVISMEGFNARNLSLDSIGEYADLAVCDVSFISQTLIHTSIFSVLKDNAVFISLLKPQFELSKSEISKHGIVNNARLRFKASERVYYSLKDSGFSPIGFSISPIKGGEGNVEYLFCSVKATFSETGMLMIDDIERIIQDEDRNIAEK